MASGPQHYETAEKLMQEAEQYRSQGRGARSDLLLRLAALHIGFARVAATALAHSDGTEGDAWRSITGVAPGASS